MDTIPFHWDTPDAPQCLRMTCLYPDECHEDLVCRLYQRRHRRRNKRHPAAKGQALRGARPKALLALDFCLFQRGSSCKPDRRYATTDMCSSTPAVRCRRNEGTCTRHHAHKYLWPGLHCQVCTKWPYLHLHDSTTLGSHALLCHDGTAAGINAIRRLKIKRCGELALRLSSRLTFAYFSVVVRANLAVNMPLRIRVGVHRVFPLTPFQGLEPFSGPT